MGRIRNGKHEDDGQQGSIGGVQDPPKQLDRRQFQDRGRKCSFSNERAQEADVGTSRFCGLEGLERRSNQYSVEVRCGQRAVAS